METHFTFFKDVESTRPLVIPASKLGGEFVLNKMRDIDEEGEFDFFYYVGNEV